MRQPATVFICDEFASLRRFDVLLEAIGRMRGFGVVFWIFLQSLSQAVMRYKEDYRMITSTMAVVSYFGGTGCDVTAKQMSEYSGKITIPIPGITENFGPQHGGANNIGLGGRDNFMPDEVMRFPLPYQMVQYAGIGMTTGVLVEPSLKDFIDYLAFMRVIEADGTARQAVTAAMEVRAGMAQPRHTPPPAPTAKKQAGEGEPRKGIFGSMLLNILGDDLE